MIASLSRNVYTRAAALSVVGSRRFASMLSNRIPMSEDFFFRQVRYCAAYLAYPSITLSYRLIILQLFDTQSSTYTYLLADIEKKEAVIIDPVLEHAKRDAQLIQELGFQLKFACKYKLVVPMIFQMVNNLSLIR